ncbi:MAG: nicotinate-nucleotide--dimethylbenzimidazole phosphoribosyltransferase [Lachnospiraceae bacterium]|nr:nicotinate-nucleotide--dimethylbenzimidazole phosphoribosyltransferase [Lachnospiraceae bacterium]
MTSDDLFSLKIQAPDEEILRLSRERWDLVAKPVDGLGYFEGLIGRIAAMQGKLCPDIEKKALIIMCADNGIVNEGVSQCGQEVTYDVASLMGRKKSSVGVMTGNYPLDIFTYDVGINSDTSPEGVINRKVRKGTADFLKEPAMSRDECLEAVNTGIGAVRDLRERGFGILATGEMGIGNTTTATALLCAMTGALPGKVTGRGAGLKDDGLIRKIRVIEQGLKLYTGGRKASSRNEAFEALRCLGGLDIAALAGVYIGAAVYRIPVVIDGLISASAALCAERMVPGCRDYMIASHLGKEGAMSLVFEELELKPVIHADLSLGEGTGAVLLFPLLDMALELYLRGTSFSDTPIDRYERFDR